MTFHLHRSHSFLPGLSAFTLVPLCPVHTPLSSQGDPVKPKSNHSSSAQNPPRVPILLREKVSSFLHDLASRYGSDFLLVLSLPHSAPEAPAPMPFRQHSKRVPTSGPLHMLFPLPGNPPHTPIPIGMAYSLMPLQVSSYYLSIPNFILHVYLSIACFTLVMSIL